jgi:BlaI family transcriptional regulator, penicillinase repressor
MSKREIELGEAELAVLRELWDGGPQTVREVMMRLHERGRRVAYTTVLTFLTRLEQKAYVASNKSGQAYVYKARVSRDQVTRSRLRNVMEQLFDGSAGPMVLQLIETEKFTPQEIASLRRLIKELDS